MHDTPHDHVEKPLHGQRVRPRHRDRHVRRPDRAVRAGGGSDRERPRRQHAIIVTAGLAEIAAGSIAMGLGGYLAARSDAEHYASEKLREEREVVNVPDVELDEVAVLFRGYGLPSEQHHADPRRLRGQSQGLGRLHDALRAGTRGARPPTRACNSAATIAGAYIVGGLIPLAPYMIIATTRIGADLLGRA